MSRAFKQVLIISIIFSSLGCTSGGNSNQPVPPSIAIQPASQQASAGAVATFSVVANGSGPLSYQWTWNGAPIRNATGSSFTIPSTVPADNGSAFTVIVSNSAGTLTSSRALLAIPGAPRAPKAGDLRFKDVDAFPFGLSLMNPEGQIIVSGGAVMSMSAKNAACSPINLSCFNPQTPYSNAWGFAGFSLPLGYPERDISGTGGSLADLDSNLAALDPETVIISLDIDSINQVYGMDWSRSPGQGNYTIFRGPVTRSNLQSTATQAGNQGQVITAITFLDHQPYYVAYSWSGDPGSQYDVQIAEATIDSIGTIASDLSATGYIITAIGGNYSDGFLLVGTRFKGDSIPRPLSVISSPPWALGRGYATNGWVIINGGAYLTIGQQ